MMPQSQLEGPEFSIITPVLNRSQFVARAIESVLNQSFGNVEHLLIDGGSKDGTVTILERYQSRYPDRIRFVSEPDQGGCEAFNKGCRMSRGRLLGWLGSDDEYTPGAIEFAATHFRSHTEDFFIYGEADFIDAEGRTIGRFATQDFSVEKAVNHGACIEFPAAFYRREVFDTIGGFRIHDRVCDHEWMIRAGKVFQLKRLPFTACRFRLHPGGNTAAQGDLVYPRANFLVNRLHGGSLLSPVCKSYYQTLLFRVPGVKWCWREMYGGYGFKRSMRREDGRIAIFGAALSGFHCLDFLSRKGVRVPLFIDNSPPPGARYCELPVVTPAEFMAQQSGETDAVMVATSPRSQQARSMRNQLLNLGYRNPIYRFGFSR
jgi:glycosyltransferase involved in cell wall biosynthesis